MTRQVEAANAAAPETTLDGSDGDMAEDTQIAHWETTDARNDAVDMEEDIQPEPAKRKRTCGSRTGADPASVHLATVTTHIEHTDEPSARRPNKRRGANPETLTWDKLIDVITRGNTSTKIQTKWKYPYVTPAASEMLRGLKEQGKKGAKPLKVLCKKKWLKLTLDAAENVEGKRSKDKAKWMTQRNVAEAESAGATGEQQPGGPKAHRTRQTSIKQYAQKNHKLTWLMDNDAEDIEGLAPGWTEKRLLEHSADGDGVTQQPINLGTPHPSMYDDTQPPVETQTAEESTPTPNDGAAYTCAHEAPPPTPAPAPAEAGEQLHEHSIEGQNATVKTQSNIAHPGCEERLHKKGATY
jgi:hypothetical protein